MLILASASQSRKELLENCQIQFVQIASNFDETSIKDKNIFNLALKLSFQKANRLSENIQNMNVNYNFLIKLYSELNADQKLKFNKSLQVASSNITKFG